MDDLIRKDAIEYGLHVRQGGWRLGLLVARCVEKGVGDRSVSRNARNAKIDGKVSAQTFARQSGTSAPRVLRYLEAWQLAAAGGHVPDAATLSPGVDPELEWDALPEWKDYYPPASGGYNGGDERLPSDAAVAKVIEAASDEQLARVLSNDPDVNMKVGRAQRDAHRAAEDRLEQAQREHLGDAKDVADRAERGGALVDLLIRAKRALRDVTIAVRNERPSDQAIADMLEQLDGVESWAGMLRGLLEGVTDDDLERLLREES